MRYSLKNDVLSLEYPIKFFISQCMHNGIAPLWFDSWALGFPLESLLTWSAFSPIQFWSSLLFKYNLYSLHVEFIVYIALSGCFMYYFLRKHFIAGGQLCLILAACYMLSGFNVGSSQWLLYITASCFTPLIFSFLIDLLKNPSLKTSIAFSVVFYTMITSVYAAFNIVVIYLLIFFVVPSILACIKKGGPVRKQLFHLCFTTLFISILCAPAVYNTLHLLSFLERGNSIVTNQIFFNSNYLPPKTLISIFFPFSSVKNIVFNTESTMFHSYLGLFPILFLPLAILKGVKEKCAKTWALFFLAILFLIISFGNLTPLREQLNVFPGFSFFRNAGLFRLYFIFFILLFLARTLDSSLLKGNSFGNKIVFPLIIFFVFLAIFLKNFDSLFQISFLDGIKSVLKELTFNQAVAISAFLQMVFVGAFIILKRSGCNKIIIYVFLCELVINTLICTPYFTVSSYSVKKVENIFQYEKGFPIQSESISSVVTNVKDENAIFQNTNIFRKRISAQVSYWGPLALKYFQPLDSFNRELYSNSILFAKNLSKNEIIISQQQPGNVKAIIKTSKEAHVTLLQNFYPGWTVTLDGRPLNVMPESPISVTIPKGGKLEFTYTKKALWYSIISINLLALLCSIILLAIKLKSVSFKFSSPSSPSQ